MNKIEIMSKALKQNMNKLEAFSVVARMGSISRSAAEIHLSQSALSHLVANLEGSLGTRLFKRKSHGLELTEEGRILSDFASRLFLDLDTLSARLQKRDAPAVTSVRVGTHETLAAHVWPKVISDISKEISGLKIFLLSGRVDRLMEMLLHGDLHAAVTVEPKNDPRLSVTTLYKGKMQFFVGNGFLPRKTNFTAKEIREIEFFTDSHAHVRQGASIPSVLEQLGLTGAERFEVSSFEAAISLAEMNLGVAVIPDRNAKRAVQEKRIRPIKIQGVSGSGLLDYQICLSTCNKFKTEKIHSLLLENFKG